MVNLSDLLLGIRPSLNRNNQTPVLYETALSKIAQKQSECGMFEQQGLNRMIHQQKVLKSKLTQLTNDFGSFIEAQQSEPKRPKLPWDNMLDEVCHIANDKKSKKKQKRIKNKKISLAIKQKWKDKLRQKYASKCEEKRIQIDDMINEQFKTTNSTKIRRRSPNIAIAKCIQTFWRNKFAQFDSLKQEFITSQSSQIEIASNTFFDSIINTKNS